MCYDKSVPEIVQLVPYIERHHPFRLEVFDWEPFYHVKGFAFPKVPVITSAEPTKLQPYQWGFIPKWCKTRAQAMDDRRKYLNLQSEKWNGTYNMFRWQRCLVFVMGFYEWQWKDSAGKEKIPHFIYQEGHKPFTLGGLYNRWVDPDTGEVFDTYGVLTTEANKEMAIIHNNKKRMPLIINEDDWALWLNREAELEQVAQLLKPAPDGLLQYHQISKDITKRGHDTNQPSTQEPLPNNDLFKMA